MRLKITFKNNPLTLVGRYINTGSLAPDFKVVSPELKEVRLSDFEGKIKLISSFPSLDTPVCDLQVKAFNKQASSLSADIVVIGISKDLPFAQKRFCAANEIKNEAVLSDYRYSSFGINYGLLIKELNLLARAVIIVDKNDVVRYFRIVPELTQAIDYPDALSNLEAIIKRPQLVIKKDLAQHCKPCEIGTLPISQEQVGKLLTAHSGWSLQEGKKITKEFDFQDFIEAKYFLDLISVVAQEQGHHPTLTLIYNKLKVTLTTHASGGLTENDFIMAGIIDSLGS